MVKTIFLDINSATQNVEINMEDLSDGMYFIKVINGKFAASKKIIYFKN
jgi:hypothetical protein